MWNKRKHKVLACCCFVYYVCLTSMFLVRFVEGEEVMDPNDQEEISTLTDEVPAPGYQGGNQTREQSMPFSRSLSMQPQASHEKRLTKFLMANYRKVGRGGRPVANSSDPVLVKFGLAMIQMGLDENDNMLTSSVWCRYRWHDEYLRWDPSEFGGVSTIRLSSSRIWIPDIMLYNTADTHKNERDVLVVINNTGEVLWIPHRIYRASCAVDVTSYPFDTQTCDMTFGSWAYHGNEIDLGFYDDMEMLDISDLERESTSWDIISKGEYRKSQYYDCCDDPYVTLTFTLSMRRKLVFSSFILTLPCIFLACMTLVVFWLPPERPDRTSLAMSLFASFLLLLLILVEAAPPTASSVPTLGLYYCFNMVLIMLSIFLSSVVINVNRKGQSMRTVPRWLKALSGQNKFTRYLCCRGSGISKNKTKDSSVRPRRRSTKEVTTVEGGVITNQEALHVNSNAMPRQVEATLTSTNGVQTNVVPASQPLLSRESSLEKQDLQVTYTSEDEAMPMSVTSNVDSPTRSSVLVETRNQSKISNSQVEKECATYSHALRSLNSRLSVLERHLSNTERGIQKLIYAVSAKAEDKEMKELEKEWKVVAFTLDRIFFLVFIVAIGVSLGTLFPRPYQLQFL